ncbi:hypothetical protein DSM106972_092020 [Dulcicalothrix desertica PCC 7102]|uniref:Uncharacterized protein n=1 Tax=Dulcicalothrix desertica PCC 7102 TaxID=232991 RepID=A0A3S1C445_9CYAN|nr:hypothetical protein [Dulcicalothrix desertica]RUS94951.1 hypothetical protein DSM106972_092020 [Dulcicalothrix desertica PCC 7102]TWH62814.1 hypothetical protein CAL7102_00344 [Dulcicalothrix desertica PCC 7102]
MKDINDTTVVLPDYIRIIEHKPSGWLFKAMKPFSTYKNVDINNFELLYGINKQQILIELFRTSGGKLGYYIADLRRKKYYYCGAEAEMVKQKLLEIGIGRVDPMENA